jgi:transposase-like protein
MAEQRTESGLAGLQGSRPWTEDEGRRVIEAWRASGLTVAAFAREAGLKSKRVYWWREQLGATPVEAGALEVRDEPRRAPVFLPVVLRPAPAEPPPGASVPVTVCAREGLRIEVALLDAASAAWVATLVRSLGEEVPS